MSYPQVTVGPIATQDIKVTEDGMLKISFTSDSTAAREMLKKVSMGDVSLPHRLKPKSVEMGCEPIMPSSDVMVRTPSGIIPYKYAATKHNTFKANATYTFNNVLVTMAPQLINGNKLYVVEYASVTTHLTGIEVQ